MNYFIFLYKISPGETVVCFLLYTAEIGMLSFPNVISSI